jgi:hypothetical protein
LFEQNNGDPLRIAAARHDGGRHDWVVQPKLPSQALTERDAINPK